MEGEDVGGRAGSEVGGSRVNKVTGVHRASPTDLEGARTMPILLVLLVAGIVELTVLVVVGQAIGVLATIALLVLASLVGAVLLRREGTRTLTAFLEAVRTHRPPHRELIDGMLIAAAGVFIVLPGFVSDVLGLLLLLPPVRAMVRRRMLRSVSRHTPGHFAPDNVVEGEVVDERRPRRFSSGELR